MNRPRVPTIDVTVVLPVHNNAATLAPLCEQLKAVLKGMELGFELLFVNDASTDASSETMKGLARQHLEVTLLELSRNVGQHIAVLHGLSKASGEVCIVMDADLQDPPSLLPSLWAARADGVAAVFGGRRGRYQSSARHFTSGLYKRVQHIITGLPLDAGMFVLMERPLVEALLEFPTRRPMLPAMIGCLAVPTISIPVERQVRMRGRSSYKGLARVRLGLKGIACVLEHRFWPAPAPYLQQRGYGVVAELTRAQLRQNARQ
jgi:glycosyltransferase involved in cell wall biosynthesis